MNAKIVSNNRIKPGYFLIKLDSPEIAEKSSAGQFVMMKAGNDYDPLLRRPMSIHRASGDGKVEVLYQVVGRGTEIFSKKQKGEFIDISGPYGNSFPIPGDSATYIFAAGGMGIAPFMFLAESAKRINNNARILLFTGGKNENDILLEKEFQGLECDMRVSTEDGSMGKKGMVTDLLKDYLKKNRDTICMYACGPTGMMKEIAGIAKTYNIDCQVSLDERMACGIGVCMGCVVKIKGGIGAAEHKCVCREGPVFNAQEVVWG